jgi:Ala-tRNA(Pro) deacylase
MHWRIEDKADEMSIDTNRVTPEMLLDFLDRHHIAHHTVHHPALYTVEQSKALRGDIEGLHVKNLFLKDKKGKLFLVTAVESTQIDLKNLHVWIGGQGRLSFCSSEQLMTYLGVEPGSVTPLSLINDRDHRVSLVLDAALLDGQRINVHPLVNTMTSGLTVEGFKKFLELTGHHPQILDHDDEKLANLS